MTSEKDARKRVEDSPLRLANNKLREMQDAANKTRNSKHPQESRS